MAKLSTFKVDSEVVETGDWIALDEYDGLELLVRGFTDAYNDAKAAKLRRAAMSYGGDVTKLPNATSRKIMIECLITQLLLDVRNLTDDAGKPVSFEQFCDILRNPDYYDLVLAVLKAAAQVGIKRKQDLDDAKKA